MAIEFQKEVCSVCGKLHIASETKHVQVVFGGGNIMLYVCSACHPEFVKKFQVMESVRHAKIEDINKAMDEVTKDPEPGQPEPIKEDEEQLPLIVDEEDKPVANDEADPAPVSAE